MKKLFLKLLKNLDSLFVLLSVVLIKIYRGLLSPLIGHNCRFYPTCSKYAIDTINKKGFLFGSPLVIGRLLRCHPFNEGGHDPIK